MHSGLKNNFAESYRETGGIVRKQIQVVDMVAPLWNSPHFLPLSENFAILKII